MFKELIEQIEHDEINNDIINRITKIINEERSIPFEITNIINDIKYRLNDEVKKSPSLPYNKNYGKKYRHTDIRRKTSRRIR